MANRLLLQSIVKFRDQIKDGTAKVFDIVEDYFNKTGKTVTEEERALILNEFAKDAPSNVTPLKSRAFDEIDETAEGFDPDYMRGTSDTDKTAGELLAESEGVDIAETILPTGNIRGKINYPLMEKQLGVKLRGNETFDELLEIEKNTRESQQGLGSLFPKGKPGEIFDVDNSKREEVATFIKDMRKAGIKNKDIKDTFKLTGTDIEQGKRAATSLARAADMGADTKGKQELLSEFDEMKMDKGPRFFQEEYMGYDSFSDAIRAKASEINNAIVDDLDRLGVDDETVTRIVSSAREVMNRNPFAGPDEMLASIKQDLEIENIKYDVTFFENLLNEYRKLMRKPEPRFAYGGMI